METSEAWITRQTKDPEIRRFYEEERLILWTTEEIAEKAIPEAMVAHGLSRKNSRYRKRQRPPKM